MKRSVRWKGDKKLTEDSRDKDAKTTHQPPNHGAENPIFIFCMIRKNQWFSFFIYVEICQLNFIVWTNKSYAFNSQSSLAARPMTTPPPESTNLTC